MVLASKTGEVRYNRKGEPGKVGPLVFPAGEYIDSETYTRTSLSAPVVLCGGEYYVLAMEGAVTGLNPKDDYATNGSNAHWIRMNKFQYAFIEVLMANFAKLGSAVFLEDYMISQKGTGYDGLPSTDYKDFNTESFASGSGNWLVEKPSSITTEIILISNEKEIKFASGVDINKGEHLIAVRKNGSYGRQLRFSYTGNPGTCQFRYYYKENTYVVITAEGTNVPPCENGYIPNIKVFTQNDSEVKIVLKNEDIFTPHIAINWNTGEVKGYLGTFTGVNILKAKIQQCLIENVFIQGSAKFVNIGTEERFLYSNFVVFDNDVTASPILKVPTTAVDGGFDLTLNAPVEFKLMNISSAVINVMFKNSSSNISQCKAYSKFTWGGATVAASSETVDFNMLSIPVGWVSKLVFIPTSKATSQYIGTWYLLDSNKYQLYYHPGAPSENYRYEMVPIPPNVVQNK